MENNKQPRKTSFFCCSSAKKKDRKITNPIKSQESKKENIKEYPENIMIENSNSKISINGEGIKNDPINASLRENKFSSANKDNSNKQSDLDNTKEKSNHNLNQNLNNKNNEKALSEIKKNINIQAAENINNLNSNQNIIKNNNKNDNILGSSPNSLYSCKSKHPENDLPQITFENNFNNSSKAKHAHILDKNGNLISNGNHNNYYNNNQKYSAMSNRFSDKEKAINYRNVGIANEAVKFSSFPKNNSARDANFDQNNLDFYTDKMKFNKELLSNNRNTNELKVNTSRSNNAKNNLVNKDNNNNNNKNNLNSSGSSLINKPNSNNNPNNISSYLKDVEEENIAEAIKVKEIAFNKNAYLNNFNFANAKKIYEKKNSFPSSSGSASAAAAATNNNQEFTKRSGKVAPDSITQRTPNKERNLEINFEEEFEEADNFSIANKINYLNINNISNNNIINNNNHDLKDFNEIKNFRNQNDNDANENFLRDTMLFTTRQKRNLIYENDVEFYLPPHNTGKNKLIHSLNEKDFLELNLKKNSNQHFIGNLAALDGNVIEQKLNAINANDIKNNDFDAKEISIFNSNPNLANNNFFENAKSLNNNNNKFFAKENNLNNINENNKSNKNLDNKQSEKTDKIMINQDLSNKCNINNSLKEKSITLENNALRESNTIQLTKNNNNLNLDNHEISGISKISYTNMNSQQNSVILNFGKRENVVNFLNNQNNNLIFSGNANSDILDSIKLNDNSLLISNVSSKEDKNNAFKDNNGNILLKKNTAHKINFKENNLDEKNSKLHNILKNNLYNKITNNNNNYNYSNNYLNEENNGSNTNRENKLTSEKLKHYYNTYEINNHSEEINLAASQPNNLNFKSNLNKPRKTNTNTNTNNNNNNHNYINNQNFPSYLNPNRKAFSPDEDSNYNLNIIFSNENTNQIINTINNTLNNTQNTRLSHNNAEESPNNSSIEEFKKNEISESICDGDLNESSSAAANDNKSVISSNVLSHIHVPKILTGIKSDMSFISYHTKSDNASINDTLNNYNNNYNSNTNPNNFNNFYLQTEVENFKNNNINNNNNLSNPFAAGVNSNSMRFRPNPYNYAVDQEFEMLNDNYDGFKYIETPKSSKVTSLNVNVLSTNANLNVLNTLTNPVYVYNNTSEKIMFQSTNPNSNLQQQNMNMSNSSSNNVNSLNNNVNNPVSGSLIKDMNDKLSRRENEVKKLNEKILNINGEIQKLDVENKRIDLMVNKEETEAVQLRHMLNYLMSKN